MLAHSLWIPLVVAVVSISCGSSSTESVCDAQEAKLHSCSLIAPTTKVRCTEPVGYDRCIVNCRNNASCSELKLMMCDMQKIGDLRACEDACEAAVPDFTCANGKVIKEYSVCNDFQNCSDGSDEAHCPEFTCADGTTVHASLRCDGREDCRDGADEAHCPTFTCKNGGQISAALHCNDHDDCGDNSDEAGCPTRLMYALTCK